MLSGFIITWLLLLLTNFVNEADDLLPTTRHQMLPQQIVRNSTNRRDYLLRGNYEGRDKISIQVPM